MTDTAEYWNDVKRNHPHVGPNYFHVPGAACGHRHLFEAKKLGDVNCRACLKLIDEGLHHDLPPGVYESKSAKKRRLKHERCVLEQENLYGRCSCGSLFTPRTNSSTRQQFLGCSSYPRCKNTKSILSHNSLLSLHFKI